MRPLTLAALIAVVPAPMATPVAPGPDPATSHAQREVLRIQHHFDGALQLLAARDLSDLSAAQRDRRARLTSALAGYRDRGLFPRNYDFGAVPTPYFVDRKTGVLCAVAHLMESTGHRDLVDRVAAANNNVWVAELAGNAEFRNWLDEHGLTLGEAARIQVPYVEDDGPPPMPGRGNLGSAMTRYSGFAAGTTVAVALANATFNAGGGRRGMIQLGYATSAVNLGLGLAAAAANNNERAMLLSSAVVATTVGVFAARRSARSHAARLRVAPILPVTSGTGAGLSVNLTF